MGVFGAIAAAADSFRVLSPGSQSLPDASARPAIPAGGPDDRTGQAPASDPTAAMATAAPAAPASRPFTGALGAQVGDIVSRQSAASVHDGCLQEIGSLFAASPTTPGLSDAFNGFVQAWQALAANPTDPAGQQSVIQRGGTLATTIRTLSQGVEQLAGRLDGAVASGVQDLNQTLAAISSANRTIVSGTALGRPTDQAEASRDQLVAKVVELTGAHVFPRDNNAVALYTASGQSLLDQRPTRFSSPPTSATATSPTTPTPTATATAGPPQAADADTVPAAGRITGGRLGALLRLTADGSRQKPAQRPDAEPGSEVIRKLRSQLDAVTGTVLGRSRANQPSSFADAYDSAPSTAAGQLVHGFFTGGNRLTLTVNPDLAAGTKTLKPAAAPAVAASLGADGRQLSADGLPARIPNYGRVIAAVSGTWSSVSTTTSRDARVADTASALISARRQGAGGIDLKAEVGNLQTLQTALGSTHQVGHAVGAFMAALGQLAPA